MIAFMSKILLNFNCKCKFLKVVFSKISFSYAFVEVIFSNRDLAHYLAALFVSSKQRFFVAKHRFEHFIGEERKSQGKKELFGELFSFLKPVADPFARPFINVRFRSDLEAIAFENAPEEIKVDVQELVRVGKLQ